MVGRIETTDALLQHPLRAKLLSLVRDYPGMGLRGITGCVVGEACNTNVEYHLNKLRQFGLLSLRDGKYYPVFSLGEALAGRVNRSRPSGLN